MVRRAVKILVFAAAAVVRTASRRTLDAMFAGCGRTDLAPSYAYGLINEAMHGGSGRNVAPPSSHMNVSRFVTPNSFLIHRCSRRSVKYSFPSQR